MEYNNSYKGIDLLDKILEFIALTPDENQWNFKALNTNKSRQIRLQRINSLLRAFSIVGNRKSIFEKAKDYFNPDLRKEIKSILSGKFLMDRREEDFEDLDRFVNCFLQEKGYDSETIRPVMLHELTFIYPKMIDYKIKLHEIIDFNSGWLEAGTTFSQFHIRLTSSISSNLVNKYKELDATLEIILNPHKLIFTEKELISKFDYPLEDLHQIDLENW